MQIGNRPSTSPAPTEEILHESEGLLGQHTGREPGLGMQSRIRVGEESAIAPLRIGSAIDNAPDLGPTQGGGTHRTRLKRDIESAIRQILAIQMLGGSRDGLHLGMGRNIAETLGKIMGARYDAVVADYDGPDRHLPLRSGESGLIEGHAHETLVALGISLVKHRPPPS